MGYRDELVQVDECVQQSTFGRASQQLVNFFFLVYRAIIVLRETAREDITVVALKDVQRTLAVQCEIESESEHRAGINLSN